MYFHQCGIDGASRCPIHWTAGFFWEWLPWHRSTVSLLNVQYIGQIPIAGSQEDLNRPGFVIFVLRIFGVATIIECHTIPVCVPLHFCSIIRDHISMPKYCVCVFSGSYQIHILVVILWNVNGRVTVGTRLFLLAVLVDQTKLCDPGHLTLGGTLVLLNYFSHGNCWFSFK